MERLSILYANALFELAREKGALDEFLEQAIILRDALGDGDVKRVLLHPQISVTEKHGIFRDAFEGKINGDMLGFLLLTVDKNREAYLLPALSHLITSIDKHNNKITANVLSAVAYDERQTGSLEAMLSNKLNKTVAVDMKVDPSVIGGPFIYADGYYIDWTVKKRLRDLTRSMKEGCNA